MNHIDIPSFAYGVIATIAAGAFLVILAAIFQNPRALAVKGGK